MKSKLFKTLHIVVVQIMREIIYSQSDSEICKWNIVLSMNSYEVTVKLLTVVLNSTQLKQNQHEANEVKIV